MSSRKLLRIVPGLLSVGVLVLLVGCGPNYKARATVKGLVTYKGKPLTVGSVTFYGKHYNMTGSATIDKTGKYEMRDAPLGDVTISVFVPDPPPGGLARLKMPPGTKDMKSVDPSGSGKSISIMGELPPEIVSIPKKYASATTSGLTYTVVNGEQTKDIPLPD